MKKPTLLGRCSTVDVFPLLDGYETIPAPTAEYMTALSDGLSAYGAQNETYIED